jgi:hypothetical protein
MRPTPRAAALLLAALIPLPAPDRPILDGTVVARHEPWLGEVAMGVVLRLWRLEASAGLVYRTNETATLQDGLRSGQLIWQASASYVQ